MRVMLSRQQLVNFAYNLCYGSTSGIKQVSPEIYIQDGHIVVSDKPYDKQLPKLKDIR